MGLVTWQPLKKNIGETPWPKASLSMNSSCNDVTWRSITLKRISFIGTCFSFVFLFFSKRGCVYLHACGSPLGQVKVKLMANDTKQRCIQTFLGGLVESCSQMMLNNNVVEHFYHGWWKFSEWHQPSACSNISFCESQIGGECQQTNV